MQLHILAAAVENAFIVIINGYGEGDLGSLLSDHIFIQNRLDLPGSGQTVRCFKSGFRGGAVIVLQNGDTKLNTLIADSDTGALDHAVHLFLALTAKGTAQFFVLIRHSYLL